MKSPIKNPNEICLNSTEYINFYKIINEMIRYKYLKRVVNVIYKVLYYVIRILYYIIITVYSWYYTECNVYMLHTVYTCGLKFVIFYIVWLIEFTGTVYSRECT